MTETGSQYSDMSNMSNITYIMGPNGRGGATLYRPLLGPDSVPVPVHLSILAAPSSSASHQFPDYLLVEY
jgi:hypothetical protein